VGQSLAKGEPFLEGWELLPTLDGDIPRDVWCDLGSGLGTVVKSNEGFVKPSAVVFLKFFDSVR
jgi:hypothetical protein